MSTVESSQALRQEIKEKSLEVTQALYRTTELISDVEPLKWALRDTAIKTLNLVTLFVSQSYAQEKMKEFDQFNDLLDSLFIKMNLASSGTFITRTNFTLLQREYQVLQELMECGIAGHGLPPQNCF